MAARRGRGARLSAAASTNSLHLPYRSGTPDGVARRIYRVRMPTPIVHAPARRAPARRFARFARGAALAAAAAVALGAAAPAPGDAPRTAGELVARMRARYDGRWFRTLTFVQRTTLRRPDGTTTVATWLEALQTPNRLRIDFTPRAAGNGLLFTEDSTYRVSGGRVAAASRDANPLLPFVAAVYVQPVARTMAQLAARHVDTAAFRLDRWRGVPVGVVGARSADDTTSPQGWVDLDRLVLVRMLAPAGHGSPATVDVHLSKYQPAGGSWIAMHLDIIVGRDTVQQEDYDAVRPDVALDSALFRAESWSAARHWSPAP